MTELFVFMPLQVIKLGNSLIGGICFKDYKITWKINVRESKAKKYLENLIVLWIKWTEIVETKCKDSIDVVPIMSCQKSPWIMG